MKWQGNHQFITLFIFFIARAGICGTGPGADLLNKVDEYIDAYVNTIHFSGAVLVAQGGQAIVDKGYGKANYEFNVPVTPQTKFRIASLTKQFAAMAVMMLAERHLLSIDDPVSVYLPDYPNGDRIKLVHLLTHTSGILDHAELPDFNTDRRVYPCDTDATIATFRDLPLEFTPGEKFSYSNSGYILLGQIIETITQMPLQDYIAKSILKPLHMNNTGFVDMDAVIPNLADGYVFKNDEIEKAAYRNIANAGASGAMYSTIDDLYLWDRALYTEQLVSKASLDAMFAPYTEHYGYGWGLVDLFNRKMVAHNGETEGFRTNISRFADDDVCIIILSNLEQTPVGKMSVDLAAMVFGEKYTTPQVRKSVAVAPALLEKYVGKYEVQPDFHLTITRDDTRLFCQATGQSKLEIHPESESKFFLKEVDAQVEFFTDDSDNVTRLVLYQGGHEIPAKKVKWNE